jgi:hypothetical protein
MPVKEAPENARFADDADKEIGLPQKDICAIGWVYAEEASAIPA